LELTIHLDKMAKQISEETKVTLDLKTLGAIGAGIVTLAGMWFALQADIAEAKELPAPVIDRIEYDLKDELIRQTILDTQEDVEAMREQLDKIDERLYELQKK
tara:strand:- start:579 stop:887 length:309 start_codon:yes stop_codon:yes gene_type:complete